MISVTAKSAEERVEFYQQRMVDIASAAGLTAMGESEIRNLYLQLCRWDSARVEREVAALQCLYAMDQLPPKPTHVAAITNLLLP